MKKLIPLLLIIFLASPFVRSQEPPETSDQIMEKAIKQAKKENKSIILMFHASWCGWCKKMDASIKDESCKDYFEKNFVVTHMVVKESANNKHLENPGAAEMLVKYNGDKSGIPFWLIFDKKGNLLADSFMRAEGVSKDQPGSNIGCPAQENEVAALIEKLKLAAPMTDDEALRITERFRQNSSR